MKTVKPILANSSSFMLTRDPETLSVPLKNYYFKGVFLFHAITCFLSGTASETLEVEQS